MERGRADYLAARRRYLGLQKDSKPEVIAGHRDQVAAARAAYDDRRFEHTQLLARIHLRKKYEFLEAVAGTVDAHVRFFRQGSEVSSRMLPGGCVRRPGARTAGTPAIPRKTLLSPGRECISHTHTVCVTSWTDATAPSGVCGPGAARAPHAGAR